MITTRGEKEIIKALTRLEQKQGTAAIRKATRAGIKVITAEAKANTPVGETGQLKRSIKTRAMKRSRVRQGHTVGLGGDAFKGDTFYGSFLNYGTKRIKPRRFLNNAAESKAQASLDTTLTVLSQEIDKAWGQ